LPKSKGQLSVAEARRYALTAQGFNVYARDQNHADVALMKKYIERIGLLQIDSVNVLARAHYLPLFSRLGLYDPLDLDALVARKPRRFFEYWGHEASLLPVDLHPLLRWRMERALQGEGVWGQLKAFAHERRPEADAVLRRITEEGPLAASDLAGGAKGKSATGPTKSSQKMWVWSQAKHAVEWLFWSGLITSVHRRGSFERVYDLPERVLPKKILATPTPSPVDAKRELIARSALALGVACAEDLRDYYRLSPGDAKEPIEQLVEDGTLMPVQVRDWPKQAYLHKDARASRDIEGAALLSPFDPLVWHRGRTERLFDFRYRLEIYKPAHLREHGYYVLPFLLNGAIVARVDLKAERKSGVLMVQSLHIEPGAPRDTRKQLFEELELMALWLGLKSVYVYHQP
jgi:uncharacterized protein YcaQ